MKTARIIAIYFGALPPWFPLWVASCSKNQDFNWLLITDHPPAPDSLPENVSVLQLDLEGFKKHAAEKLGFEPCIPGPYKLCDFRPAFGDIFSEYLEGYRFWGFCDLDVLFGRLSHFINEELLESYDRILTRGHLTLLRNSPRICGAYRGETSAPHYKTVFTEPKNFIYDEWPGLHIILSENQVPQFEEEIVADIDPNVPQFQLTQHANYASQAFTYKDGRVEQLYWDEETQKIRTKEFPYIHFQKRKLNCLIEPGLVNHFALTPHGFVSLKQTPQSRRELNRLNRPTPWWKRDRARTLAAWRIFLGEQRRRLIFWKK